MLISPTNFQTLADYMGGIYRAQKEACSGKTGITQMSQNALTAVLAFADYDASHDMLEPFEGALSALVPDAMVRVAGSALFRGLTAHINRMGVSVDSSITNIASYCKYYNTGAGGTWISTVSEDFAAFCTACGSIKFPKEYAFPHVEEADTQSPGMGALEYQAEFISGADYSGRGTLRVGNAKNACVLCVEKDIESSCDHVTMNIYGKNQNDETTAIFTATIGKDSFKAGSEVPIIPQTPNDRIANIESISVDLSTPWTAGKVYVKPVQERMY